MTILAFSIAQFHQDGGTVFMYPLSTLLLLNFGIIIYQVIGSSRKKVWFPNKLKL